MDASQHIQIEPAKMDGARRIQRRRKIEGGQCPRTHSRSKGHSQQSHTHQKSSSYCCCCYVASVVSDSVRPQRRQPTRLPRPWHSPGKNTGVGCHFLLQCIKVKSESEVAQSCPTLSDPMDCSLPGSSIHGIL